MRRLEAVTAGERWGAFSLASFANREPGRGLSYEFPMIRRTANGSIAGDGQFDLLVTNK